MLKLYSTLTKKEEKFHGDVFEGFRGRVLLGAIVLMLVLLAFGMWGAKMSVGATIVYIAVVSFLVYELASTLYNSIVVSDVGLTITQFLLPSSTVSYNDIVSVSHERLIAWEIWSPKNYFCVTDQAMKKHFYYLSGWREKRMQACINALIKRAPHIKQQEQYII